MKGKIDENAIRIDGFVWLMILRCLNKRAEIMLLPFKSCITPSRPKVNYGVRLG